MKRNRGIAVGLWVAMMAGAAWAQNDSSAPPSSTPPSDTQQAPGAVPVPAFGQSTSTSQGMENPPISSTDEPVLESGGITRSFVSFGAHATESADSNAENQTGSSSFHSVTRALGSMDLQKLWRQYATRIGYVGGVAGYAGLNRNTGILQEVGFDQRFMWKTGQLAIRDAFSYLPEGAFGYGAFGGAGGYQSYTGFGPIGGGLGGSGFGRGFYGGSQFGALGQTPRITNLALGELSQLVTPRSAVTLTGSYALTHFTEDTTESNGVTYQLINSQHIAAQAGYNYELNKHDQLGIVFGYQDFRYPVEVAGSFNTYLVNVLYGHRISGRMDLVLGGGPQVIYLSSTGSGESRRITGSGRASLRYQFPRTGLEITYFHYTTSGSGFFAGADTHTARVNVSHPLSRDWTINADGGYSHNDRLQSSLEGVQAKTYQVFYVGASAHKKFGRYWEAFLSYSFHDLTFDQSFCGSTPNCSRNSLRNIVLVGVDWHPRPIRLD
jgi:hypothetical protein